jgi:hypothetical protein
MKCIQRFRNRDGRCYELAHLVMQRAPGAERFSLVHGRVAQIKGNKDVLIPHAWIELNDGRMYDPVKDKYLPVDEYAAVRHAVVERRYSRDEAMRMAATQGHWGPWEPFPSL